MSSDIQHLFYSRARRLVGSGLRRSVVRPGRSWTIPFGIGRGLRIEIDPSAPLHLYLGTLEMEIAPYVRAFARPGCRSMEIGSHNAYYGLVMARLTENTVVSVDFDTAALRRMQRNLDLNPQLAALVRIEQAYVAYRDDASVGAMTLDSLIATRDIDDPDLLQIDVEGAEVRVLEGAGELLARRKPHVIIESHGQDLEAHCLSLLAERGYRPIVVDRRTRFREHREGHNRWLIAQGEDQTP